MKKFYFVVLSFSLGLNLNMAQTILTKANHAPLVGDVFKTRQCDSTGLTPGASGAGATWTFTMSIRTPTTTYNGVTVASTGTVAASYPSASVAVQSGTNNSFYSSTTNALSYWGGNLPIKISGINVTTTYASPAVYATYSMALNSTSAAAVSGTVSAGGINGSFTGTSTTIGDGTGTLILPSRTFSNCLRVMTTQTLNFSVTFPPANGTVFQTTYDYYNVISKSPLFTILDALVTATVAGSPQSSSYYLATINSDYLTVGINETTKEISNLNLYPNPAKANFNLSFVNENAENASYEMINALGQTIKKENLGSEKGNIKYNISLEGIDSGIYFVKIYVGNSTSVKKITVQ